MSVEPLVNLSRSVPELMSPAGDWDALRAAVANGADAVYFGLDNFNARHRAHNFTRDTLPKVMAYLHAHNVKGYLTFNVLIFSDELAEAADLVKQIAAAGVDAVIVQDLGLARLIRAMAPGLAVHGSTQMTLTEPRGIEFVRRELGVERVVLAREMSAKDIAAVRAATDTPVEVFIHGALCVAYSGQCLTSESLGGRSANRGQCAQACRLPYDLVVDGEHRDIGDKAYLLSPQDLAAYDLVEDLVRLGVSCFKIEGRLKSAQYVAATTRTYRRALDAAIAARSEITDLKSEISNLESEISTRESEIPAPPSPTHPAHFEISDTEKRDLAQIFSRGFTHGFLDGVDHSELVPALFPKSRGVRVGVVERVTRRGVVVRVDPVSTNGRMRLDPGAHPLKPGDGVVFDQGRPEQDEQGGRIFEVFAAQAGAARPPARGTGYQPVKNASPARQTPRPQLLELTFGRAAVDLDAIAPGAIVWKTDDPDVRKRLEQSYARDVVARRVPVRAHVEAAVGRPLRVTLTDPAGLSATAESPMPLERAQKHPLTLDALREQLSRLGDTPFELADVTADPLEPAMVPKSVLNEVRREAAARLHAAREETRRRPIAEPDALARLRAQAAALRTGPPPGCVRQVPAAPSAVEPLSAPSSILHPPSSPEDAPALTVLARTLDQLAAVAAWQGPIPLDTVYCDFEDPRKYKDAVAIARGHGFGSPGRPLIALATTRIIKPGEEGLLRLVASAAPDAFLVRNLAGLSFFSQEFPGVPLIGDYSLNVANELTAALFHACGLRRLVPGYDLNWKQLEAMLARVPPALFEAVVHQHMPMFHMEHCVFCHTLSTGKDYRDCGRPCDLHKVDLRDRYGQAHPLIADVGCRNTVYNAQAQSGAEFIPRMLSLGLRLFRVEMLREGRTDVAPLLDRYADVIAGKAEPRAALRSLRVLNQLGVTAGTLDHE